jgi:hypothetical protein
VAELAKALVGIGSFGFKAASTLESSSWPYEAHGDREASRHEGILRI